MCQFCVSLFLFTSYGWAQSVNNIPVTVEAQDQILPQSIGVGDGVFVVWIDSQTDGDQIQYMKLSPRGVPDSTTLGSISFTGERIGSFDIDSNSDESFYVAWAGESSDRSSIRVMKLDASGQQVWDKPTYLTESEFNFREPHITDDLDGGCYVVWQRSSTAGGDDPNDIDLYAQQLGEKGATTWNQNAVIINKNGQQIFGDVTALRTALVVAWQDGNTVRLGAYNRNDGNAVSDQDGIAPGTGFIMRNPQIIHVKSNATTIQNEVIVVWEQAGFLNINKEVYAQKMNIDGDRLWGSAGERVATNSNDPRSPQIVNDEQQGVIIVWQEHRNPSRGIYAQRFDEDGNRLWSNSGIELTGENAYDAKFHIAHDNQQGVYLTWEDAQNGDLDVWAQYVKGDESLPWGEKCIVVSQHG
ncbi:MAG: hypothetical protein DWQ10_00110, partial [Calditrichaeota bacterium]